MQPIAIARWRRVLAAGGRVQDWHARRAGEPLADFRADRLCAVLGRHAQVELRAFGYPSPGRWPRARGLRCRDSRLHGRPSGACAGGVEAPSTSFRRPEALGPRAGIRSTDSREGYPKPSLEMDGLASPSYMARTLSMKHSLHLVEIGGRPVPRTPTSNNLGGPK